MVSAAREVESAPDRLELHRLVGDVRRIISAVVSNRAPLEELTGMASALEELAAQLESHSVRRAYDSFAESANAGTPYSYFDHSPVMGPANPLAPPAYLRIEGDRVVGTVRFGPAYEGPPGHVHGGYVAALFDELLGMTQSLSGQTGMTGTLVVRYRRPTPLEVELDLEGEVVKVEGRKVFVAGRCLHDGRLTAESEGIFVSVASGRLATMLADRESGE